MPSGRSGEVPELWAPVARGSCRSEGCGRGGPGGRWDAEVRVPLGTGGEGGAAGGPPRGRPGEGSGDAGGTQGGRSGDAAGTQGPRCRWLALVSAGWLPAVGRRGGGWAGSALVLRPGQAGREPGGLGRPPPEAGARLSPAPLRHCCLFPVKSRRPSLGELLLRHAHSPTRARQAAQLGIQPGRDSGGLGLGGGSPGASTPVLPPRGGTPERQGEALRVKNAVYCAVIFPEFLKELAAISQAHAVTSPFLLDSSEEAPGPPVSGFGPLNP